VAGLAVVAHGAINRQLLNVVYTTEQFSNGLATAALFTCMMDWCSSDASATDYTVQASTVVIATAGASAVAGFSAQALGYFGHFCLATALALCALLAVRLLFPSTTSVRPARGRTLEVAPCG
jgi:PAT family beta-lactamase induction signal transducer AmpG